MKETWADELCQTTVHITSPDQFAYRATITRCDTGEPVENVHSFVLAAQADGILWVTLILLHVKKRSITYESITLPRPQLDCVAKVAHCVDAATSHTTHDQ